MDNVGIIGNAIYISKRSFPLHGATDRGNPVLRGKLPHSRMVRFLALQTPCLVVIEARDGAHSSTNTRQAGIDEEARG